MIEIRKSNIHDKNLVIEIWRNSVNATHDFLTEKDKSEIENEFYNFLPIESLWLAEENNITKGFMLLDNNHIEALFIDAESRGKGIGKTLINFAFSLNKNLTVDVNEQNSQAMEFYNKFGFVKSGRSENENRLKNFLNIFFSFLS